MGKIRKESPERNRKASIRKLLKKLPDTKFFPYNPYYGTAGIPDIIGCCKIMITPEMVGKDIGLFVGIEVKRPGGKLTELQAAQIKALRKVGGAVFVAKTREEAILGIANYKVYLGV